MLNITNTLTLYSKYSTSFMRMLSYAAPNWLNLKCSYIMCPYMDAFVLIFPVNIVVEHKIPCLDLNLNFISCIECGLELFVVWFVSKQVSISHG